MVLNGTASNKQLHKTLIALILAVEKLEETIHQNSYIDRGATGLRNCRELLKDAHKHLAFDVDEDQTMEDEA